MQDFSRIVLRNSAFGMAAQLAIKVLSFLFTIMIVRQLGAEDYGQYVAAMAFGAVFLFIADLGLGSYTVREVARLRDDPEGLVKAGSIYTNVLALRLCLSLVAGVVMVIAAWLTGRSSLIIGAIALNAVTITLYSVQGTSDAILAGFERLDLSAGSKVVYQLAFVMLGGLALVFGLGYYGLIGATIIAVVCMTYVCWSGVRRLGVRLNTIAAQDWVGLLKASLPFGVISFTLGLSYKFDTVLLNIYHGDLATGYYNAAYNLVFSAAMLSNVINVALYPSLSRQIVSNPQSLPAIFERVVRYLLVLALPVAVGGCVLAQWLVPFLFGEEYLPAIIALQIVIWVVPFMFTSEFLGYIVLVQGNEKRAARVVMVSTSINIALNLILIPQLGYIGAAAMTVVTEVVLVSQYLWMLRDSLKHIALMRNLLQPLLAALLMGVVVIIIQPYLPLLATVAVGAAVYAVLLLVQNIVGRDEIRFFRGIRSGSEVTLPR